MIEDRIALQLYTVREAAGRDMLGTLRRLGDMGYSAVEFAGYGGVEPRQIRAALNTMGMQAMSAHIALKDLQTAPDPVFDTLTTLGCTYAVVPSSPEEYQTSAEGVQRLADLLNGFGATARQHGLQLGYHNHAKEFAPLAGTTMWDLLAAATDPALVALEFDIYWAQYGGVDPLMVLQKYAGRLPLLHIKDMAAGESRADVPVGEGGMPWPAILAAGRAAGAQWYIIEQDHPQDPLADVEKSLHNLTRLLAAAGAGSSSAQG